MTAEDSGKEKQAICKKIKEEVELLSTAEIEELFKIFHTNNTVYSRNNNGVFINLSWLSDSVLNKIKQYVEFCIESRKEIKKYETMRENYNIEVKSMNEEEIEELSDVDEEEELVVKENKVKDISIPVKKSNSNIKFYLIKKKFQKNVSNQNKLIEDVLTHETYSI